MLSDVEGARTSKRREPVVAPRPMKRSESEHLVLTEPDRKKLDTTVDKALEFLANHQNSDGSFETVPMARPAVTSLCVMAFLSRGHRPGEGTFGKNIDHAIDYVLEFQDPESGAFVPPGTGGLWSRSVNYTHGICGVMLADVYPLTGRVKYQGDRVGSEAIQADTQRHSRIEKAVKSALSYARNQQTKPKVIFGEQGGWRYINSGMRNDSDLSVTAWMVMFLHSARKSGFKVPDKWFTGALKFVHRTFDKHMKEFVYTLSEGHLHSTRATMGGGILCLILGGESVTPQVRDAADWVGRQTFEPYNYWQMPGDRYHYSAFYCSQAMGVLGGSYFQRFYPNLLRVLSENQKEDGSWDIEGFPSDRGYGNLYSTAFAVLALSPPYQMLKTYQR
jgi:hypothetical protein